VDGRKSSDEFELIARYFAPLAAGSAGAHGLADDVALIDVAPDESLIVTTDCIVSGVHFLPDDPADLIARKLLRVNLSDLAGKGARPLGYFMACAFPGDIDQDWLERYAAGLAVDQREFAIGLMGGDTARTPGAMTLTVTALGAVAKGKLLRRSGARIDDAILVSGTLGDGALGLDVVQGRLEGLGGEHLSFLADRYRLPRPRVALGMALAAAGIGHAAMDISDGLAADLGHVCRQSGVGARVEWARIPLSAAAGAALANHAERRARIVAGGDDYEILITMAEQQVGEAQRIAANVGVPLSALGHVVAGSGVAIIDETGTAMALPKAGYSHF
jgi:thiamine-monophosphate kinase